MSEFGVFQPPTMNHFETQMELRPLQVVLFGDAQRTCEVAFLLRGMSGTKRAERFPQFHSALSTAAERCSALVWSFVPICLRRSASWS